MKAADLRGLSDAELQDKLVSEQKSLNKLRLTHTISELENLVQIRYKRRIVARINTEVKRRELVKA